MNKFEKKTLNKFIHSFVPSKDASVEEILRLRLVKIVASLLAELQMNDSVTIDDKYLITIRRMKTNINLPFKKFSLEINGEVIIALHENNGVTFINKKYSSIDINKLLNTIINDLKLSRLRPYFLSISDNKKILSEYMNKYLINSNNKSGTI